MPNPIKPNLKTEIIPIIMIIISFAASFYFYAHFPPIVATHWNYAGEPNGWSSKEFGAFGMPLLAAGIYLMLLFFPMLDPKKDRYLEFRKVYHIFKGVIIFFLAFIYFVASLNDMGHKVPVEFFVPIMVGLLFIIIGNYMGKIKSNWFAGVRTPWTLSDEEVWNKTNRLSGKLFMFGGLGMVLEAFVPNMYKLPLFILIILGLVVVPVVYSYIVYRKKY